MRVTLAKVDAKRYTVAIEREHGLALVPRPELLTAVPGHSEPDPDPLV